MRSDFLTVYAEPSKCSGGGWLTDARVKGRKPNNYDDMLHQVGMSEGRRRGWTRKEKRYSWSTLRRWLGAQVDRPWNDVWSEICQVADRRTKVGYDLRQSVLSMVENSYTFKIDEDGFLRRTEENLHWRGYKEPSDPDVIDINAHIGLRRINGIWFEIHYGDIKKDDVVSVKDLPAIASRSDPYVVIDGEKVFLKTPLAKSWFFLHPWNESKWWHTNKAGLKAYFKRSLTSDELFKHGLQNDLEWHSKQKSG